MLKTLASNCTSHDFCSSPGIVGIASVPLPFRHWCTSLPPQEMFPWPATVPTVVKDCFKFVKPCWSSAGKVQGLFVFRFFFSSFFFLFPINKISATPNVAFFVILFAMYCDYLSFSWSGSPLFLCSCFVVPAIPPAVTQHTDCNANVYTRSPVCGRLDWCGGGLLPLIWPHTFIHSIK